MANIFDTKGRREEQYQTALAKAPEKRNFLEKALVTAGDRRNHVGGQSFSMTKTSAAEASAAETVRVVEYTSQKDMQTGIQQMLSMGWTMQGQSSYTPKKGAGRAIAGGLLFFNPTPRTVVTFVRSV